MSFASSSAATDLVALDIGGANLKAADGLGWATSTPFAMWREWPRLADAIAAIIRPLSPRRVVATMTGEIADCFPSRAAGVRHIVAAVATAAGPAEVGVYCVDGAIVDPAEASAAPLRAAASNWHAVARLAGSMAPTDRAFLIDIGSTTVDITPLCDGRPTPMATDDAGRMRTGELVYTGMERTPIAAFVRALPHRGTRRPVASERFADSRDAWLVLGALPADEVDRDTADGQPATPDAARIRLARMMLLEPDNFTRHDALHAAEWCARGQARIVARALHRVADGVGWRPSGLVLSGHGDPLADRAAARAGWQLTRLALRDRCGPHVSRSAPAHALALIARGMIR
jgi:probable H4MPT-linked C1 transfer pathway protein